MSEPGSHCRQRAGFVDEVLGWELGLRIWVGSATVLLGDSGQLPSLPRHGLELLAVTSLANLSGVYCPVQVSITLYLWQRCSDQSPA